MPALLKTFCKCSCQTLESTSAWIKERRISPGLLQNKRESFWMQKIDAEKSSHINCGVLSMYCWAAVVSHPVTTSTPNRSNNLTPSALLFDLQLMVLCRRPSQHHRPMSISPVMSQSPSTKWSLRSECNLTRAALLMLNRLQHSSPLSMFSHRF